MYIDTHAHIDLVLNKEEFMLYSESRKKTSSLYTMSDIIPETLEYVIHISLDCSSFIKTYSLLKDYHKIFFATGIYPDRTTYPDYNENEYIAQLKKILTTYPHVALGEAGIDFKSEQYGSKEAQESLFRKQVELAEELNLPLIIHSRDSFDECYKIISDYPSVRTVMHCFSYGVKEADLLLSRGDYLSFSGLLTYKNTAAIKEAAKIAPLDQILFETDAPYLSPEPFRNTWNIPSNVEYIYKYFSELKGISLEELIPVIKSNARKCFKIML